MGILGTDQEKEYGCLIAENEAHHAQKDACGRVQTMLMTISGSEPAKLAYLTKTLNRTLTVERALPAIKQNLDFYSKAHVEIQAASAKCSELYEIALKKHQECEVDHAVVVKFFCFMKEGRDKQCGEYAKCFQEANANYQQIKLHVEKTEAINKEHFTQMACSEWVQDTAPH